MGFINLANIGSKLHLSSLLVKNFVGIQVFLRDFYDSLNQIDSTFSSKVIILRKNPKNYLKIQ